MILFEFATNNSVNPSTSCTPFYMVYGKHPTHLVLHSISSNVPRRRTLYYGLIIPLLKPETAYAKLKLQMLTSMLRTSNHTTSNLQLPSKKLSQRWLGPFQIAKFKKVNTAELILPRRLAHIKPVQNVCWLCKYKFRPTELGPMMVHQLPDIIDRAEENEVEVILADCYSCNHKQYLVCFISCGPEDNLWLPLRNLTNCP